MSVPEGREPIFQLQFPDWAIYGDLTAYTMKGQPIASFNNRQHLHQDVVMTDPRIESDDVILLRGASWTGPLLIVYRLYKPFGMEAVVCSPDSLPAVRVYDGSGKGACVVRPKGQSDAEAAIKAVEEALTRTSSPDDKLRIAMAVRDDVSSGYLRCSTIEDAMVWGKACGLDYQRIVASLFRVRTNQKATQFFAPTSPKGLFVNAHAKCVFTFPSEEMGGMRLTATAPLKEEWRPFYGFTVFDHLTTATIDAVMHDQLGWGNRFVLFVVRSLDVAFDHGYNPQNLEHHVITWGDAVRPGLMLRYLHYFQAADGVEGFAHAQEERRRLTVLDGTQRTFEQVKVHGMPRVEYLEGNLSPREALSHSSV
mmetsp:Transcript_17896/g.24176  ORF Transcript_17896/g.24176 Transcript_17896/m.24176 type:complete len:366 (-) Transcript_17896:57-1154(-)